MVREFSNGFTCELVYSFIGGPPMLSNCVRTFDSAGEPVFYSLSQEGVDYVAGIIQQVGLNFSAE